MMLKFHLEHVVDAINQAMQSQKRGRVRAELVNSLDTVIRLTLHVLEQKRNLGGEAAVQVAVLAFFLHTIGPILSRCDTFPFRL